MKEESVFPNKIIAKMRNAYPGHLTQIGSVVGEKLSDTIFIDCRTSVTKRKRIKNMLRKNDQDELPR
jgi:hypothetical protein